MGADLNWRVLANARWLKRASPEAGWAEPQSCCFHVCWARWGSPLQQTSQWLKRNDSTCKTCSKRGRYTCRQCLMHVCFYNVHQAVNGPSRQLLAMEEIFLLLSFSGVQKGYQVIKFHLGVIDNRRSMFWFFLTWITSFTCAVTFCLIPCFVVEWLMLQPACKGLLLVVCLTYFPFLW